MPKKKDNSLEKLLDLVVVRLRNLELTKWKSRPAQHPYNGKPVYHTFLNGCSIDVYWNLTSQHRTHPHGWESGYFEDCTLYITDGLLEFNYSGKKIVNLYNFIYNRRHDKLSPNEEINSSMDDLEKVFKKLLPL